MTHCQPQAAYRNSFPTSAGGAVHRHIDTRNPLCGVLNYPSGFRFFETHCLILTVPSYLSLSVKLFRKFQPWPFIPFHRMNYLSRTRKLVFRCNFRPATCFRPVDLLLSVWEEESGKVAFCFPCLGRVIKCYHDDIILLSPVRFELLLNQNRTSSRLDLRARSICWSSPNLRLRRGKGRCRSPCQHRTKPPGGWNCAGTVRPCNHGLNRQRLSMPSVRVCSLGWPNPARYQLSRIHSNDCKSRESAVFRFGLSLQLHHSIDAIHRGGAETHNTTEYLIRCLCSLAALFSGVIPPLRKRRTSSRNVGAEIQLVQAVNSSPVARYHATSKLRFAALTCNRQSLANGPQDMLLLANPALFY